MAFTIEKLIQALQNVAEDSEQGLETPIIFQAITSNEDVSDVLTTIEFGSLGVVGYLEGQFLQFEFLINDDALSRLNWSKKGCP